MNKSATNQFPKLPEKLHVAYQKRKFSRIRVKDSASNGGTNNSSVNNSFVISGNKIAEK